MPFGSGVRCAPTFTWQPRHIAERINQRYSGKRVVDLGAGEGGSCPGSKRRTSLDARAPDHVCDFVKYRTPFKNGSVDLVVATGVLEHVEDDRTFLDEIWRILKPRGVVHLEIPFLQWQQ